MSASKKIIGWDSHPESRRDKRRRSPTVVIKLDDATYPSDNWSIGGVLLSDYYGERAPGMEVEGSLRLATGFECHGFTAVVVRRNLNSGAMALHFIQLSEGAFALLDGASLGVEDSARAAFEIAATRPAG